LCRQRPKEPRAPRPDCNPAAVGRSGPAWAQDNPTRVVGFDHRGAHVTALTGWKPLCNYPEIARRIDLAVGRAEVAISESVTA
jgi:hypothetical protein